MRGLKALAATVLGVVLLASVAPISAASATSYKHYVACGVSQHATASKSCPKKSKKGAFFESVNADVFYTVCVKFPTGRNLCAPHQEATRGTLYVNKVTSNIPGKHRVTWFVAGKRVGFYAFDVKE